MSQPYTVYWHEEGAAPAAGMFSPGTTSLGRDLNVDVIVIGGGFTGLSTAIHLKERHPDLGVAVFEDQHVGWGASGRNTGFLTPLIGHDLYTLRKKLGDEMGKRVATFGTDAVRTVEHLIEKYDIGCQYESTGLANPAISTSQLKTADKLADAANAFGMACSRWSRRECQQQLGSELFKGAFYQPAGGILQPYRLVRGLLAAAQKLGVDVYEQSGVQEVQPGPQIKARVNGHVVTGDYAVVATNAYSELPFTRRFYAPLHVYTVVSEPLTDEQLAEIGWGSRTGFYTLHHLLYALRLTHDNRIVAATGNARYYWNNKRHIREQSDDYKRLEASIPWHFPALADLQIQYRWEGVLAVTLSDFPALGRHHAHPNLLYGLAYCGHGVSLANHTGMLLAELLDGDATEWEDLPFVHKKPFPPVPGEPLRKGVATVYLGLLRALDWWNNRGLGAP